MSITQGLNDAQMAAVAHTDGPLLIMAGAGSGKTKVLTCKIAALLEKGVSPFNILAITFTNKAATEMRQRVDNMIGDAAKHVWLSTFHAFCARFLRSEITASGKYESNFGIYDSSDSQTLIKNCLKELNLDEKQYQPRAIQAAISNAKNMLLTPEKFAVQAGGFFEKKVAEVYVLYQRHLQENNALDFDDLLSLSVEILSKDEFVRGKYQERFKYILVDEYQDTNGAQYQLTKLLSAKYRNLCVVGDADQSIYGWRGADITNIINFEKDYPDATVIKLEQNYRSTKTILQAANAVIENNTMRKPKELWTSNPQGDKIIYYKASDGRDEASFICNEVVKQQTVYNYSYSDVAVLYRTNAQSRTLEEGFMRAGIPYTMVGGLKFYDRKEIKDIVAYLRLLHNPNDNIALNRIINVPKRAIGAATMAKVEEGANMYGISQFDLICNPEIVPVAPKVKAKLQQFAEMIMSWTEQINQPLEKLITMVMNQSGYMDELESEKTIENQTRIENLKELLSVANDFTQSEEEPTLENFLGSISLLSDIDGADLEEEKVTLMTMHAAKGLEFPIVFIAGMEEGLFPHSRTLMDESQIEEERRTCYVGITRAERKLYLTNARERMMYGHTNSNIPSRFLAEIPEEYLDIQQKKSNSTFGGSYGSYGHNSGYSSNNSFGGTTYGARPTGGVLGGMPKIKATNSVASTNGGGSVIRPDMSVKWQVGDKAKHNKWGIGTVVSIKGEGEEVQITIAFPGVGIKPLMQKYAPISKV